MPALDQSIQNETRHAIYINRFAGGLANQFNPYLDQLKKSIREQLLSSNITSFEDARLRAAIAEITRIQKEIYAEYQTVLYEQLKLFTDHESDFELQSLNSVIESDVDLSKPAANQLWSAAVSNPLIFPDSNDTVLLRPFVKGWSDNQIRKVSNIINTGFATGKTTNQIAKEVTDKNGILDKQTRAANKLMVRTATVHVSAQARMATLEDNDDIVKGYVWKSVLDDRTTAQCRSLDGEEFRWSDSFKPQPPYHVGCRSTTVPLLDERYNLDEGLATRASKGAEGGKQVNADTTYYSFLKRQPKAFQDDVLGPTRGRLLRNGGLNAEEFAKLTVDDKFRPLTLDEMRKRNPLVFENAGL